MNRSNYKSLSKTELLELLIEESEKNERLEEELSQAKAKLSSREIQIENAGSIAEAALALSGIFDAAEDACAQYIENIQRLKSEQEKINADLEADSKKRAEQIISEATQRANRIEDDVRSRCEKMVDLAGADVAQFRKKIMEFDLS